MPELAAEFTVYHRKSRLCGHTFFETEGNELTWCPHCGKIIPPERVIDLETIRHEITVDPATGDLEFHG